MTEGLVDPFRKTNLDERKVTDLFILSVPAFKFTPCSVASLWDAHLQSSSLSSLSKVSPRIIPTVRAAGEFKFLKVNFLLLLQMYRGLQKPKHEKTPPQGLFLRNLPLSLSLPPSRRMLTRRRIAKILDIKAHFRYFA